MISSEDTDVFVLCLAFEDFVPATIYWKCGTQTRTRYISITNVVQRHGSGICKCRPLDCMLSLGVIVSALFQEKEN